MTGIARDRKNFVTVAKGATPQVTANKSRQRRLVGSITGKANGATRQSSWLRVVVQLLFKEHPKGRNLTWLLCLLTLAGHIGLAFTPRVALPGENLPMYFTQTAQCHHPATLRQPVGLEGDQLCILGLIIATTIAAVLTGKDPRSCLLLTYHMTVPLDFKKSSPEDSNITLGFFNGELTPTHHVISTKRPRDLYLPISFR
ncbi:hypothetical protein AVEN_68635-1 [Araneus ventricosus]|uniref:Uncharacterized protein n=1 Tax=Araneus ventricosus TaxID=182803 RepID=A0A4Y2QLR4_ARAVE|nr:hypothetical protein AVEN_68635-1 [Araneus ventricosus]